MLDTNNTRKFVRVAGLQPRSRADDIAAAPGDGADGTHCLMSDSFEWRDMRRKIASAESRSAPRSSAH